MSSDWLPAAFNRGHAYRDRLSTPAPSVISYYAERYRHSDQAVWRQRLAAGEICCNGRQLRADAPLAAGDRLVWCRPPWQESAVPLLSERSIVFDDGDLLVLNKPSGLPVLPAGGFLEHTLLAQLQGWVQRGVIDPAAGAPRPLHRLGRFTSGLLVCARRSASRAWLSAQLRESTHIGAALDSTDSLMDRPCRKLYRTLVQPLPADWQLGESRLVTTAIGRRPHPLLGEIWCAADPIDPAALPAHSSFTLLERRPEACLLAVAIATGRPHQIRIHAAALGAPLLGDPLYVPGGFAQSRVLPGDGGYLLHAHQVSLRTPGGEWLELEAEPAVVLQAGSARSDDRAS